MAEKPTTAAEYQSEQLGQVRAACLYLATKLGDLVDDLVVVGGLVPSLLVDQENLAEDVDAHVGTMDLDVGLTVAVLDQGRYRELTATLRRAGFSQDETQEGRPTRQRWKITRGDKVTVDFLIQPTRPEDRGGSLRDIERDFAAIIAPGLQLAFEDRRRLTLSGRTTMGEDASRDVWVCGPGAYVVLKALAFDLRGENKDAYDLFYVLRNYGGGVEEVSKCLRPLLVDSDASRALAILQRDFLDHDGVGPRRVAEFLVGRRDDAIQADVVGYIEALLRLLRAEGPRQ
jgi:hypothetical protein